jgi:hypothetical protein
MKIQSSSISMSGESVMAQNTFTKEKLNAWDNTATNSNQNSIPAQQDAVELSDQGKTLQSQASGITGSTTVELGLDDIDRQKIDLLQRMLEYLTGKRIRFVMPERVKLDDMPKIKLPDNAQLFDPSSFNAHSISLSRLPVSNLSIPRLGWGVKYESHETYEESQKMSFNAAGNIQTSDGRKISFDMQLI